MASADGSVGVVQVDAVYTTLPNDNFIDAATTDFAVDSTVGATRESGEPQPVQVTQAAASIWYRYLAPTTMPAQNVTEVLWDWVCGGPVQQAPGRLGTEKRL